MTRLVPAAPIYLLVNGGAGGVMDFAHELQALLPDARVVPLTPETSLSDLGGAHLILQYSGYGFQKRGTPLWLLPRVRELKKDALSFGVFFHELYASGPPWGSAFWLSSLQQHIVKQLAGLADYWLTNREASAQWLRAQSAERPHQVLPICSNVGEPAWPMPSRQSAAAVFGTPALRELLYRQHGDELLAWARQTGSLVHDIGTSIRAPALALLLQDPCVQQHGRLERGEVSALLQSARYGLTVYPIAFIAKSSVFAAYCAHGACPVVFSTQHDSADGLAQELHYLPALPSAPLDATAHEAVGQRAWTWYQAHRVQAHAQALLTLSAQACKPRQPPEVLS